MVDRGVSCAMRDGCVLVADVYRPDDAERHPVLVVRTPYDRTYPENAFGAADPLRLADAGYAVVVQDVRGRFGSEGVYETYVAEAEDGHDTIAWASQQDWSDGNVGMYGISYMAQAQYLAASEGPPALRAIAPFQSPDNATGGDRYRGGALSLGLLCQLGGAGHRSRGGGAPGQRRPCVVGRVSQGDRRHRQPRHLDGAAAPGALAAHRRARRRAVRAVRQDRPVRVLPARSRASSLPTSGSRRWSSLAGTTSSCSQTSTSSTSCARGRARTKRGGSRGSSSGPGATGPRARRSARWTSGSARRRCSWTSRRTSPNSTAVGSTPA